MLFYPGTLSRYGDAVGTSRAGKSSYFDADLAEIQSVVDGAFTSGTNTLAAASADGLKYVVFNENEGQSRVRRKERQGTFYLYDLSAGQLIKLSTRF